MSKHSLNSDSSSNELKAGVKRLCVFSVFNPMDAQRIVRVSPSYTTSFFQAQEIHCNRL